ncbi:Mur ligase family protein [Methanopyrus sp.]
MSLRSKLAELVGLLALKSVRFGPGMGRSFPGWTVIKVGDFDAVRELARRPEYGVVLITGTNGKTTTTRLACALLAEDAKVSCNYDSNTINAVTTGLLKGRKAELVVTEYGIRSREYGIPDIVCELVNPLAIAYTTISKEHFRENADKEDPFGAYFEAKRLLARPLKDGVLILNADDPRVTYIRDEKRGDPVEYVFYGLDVEIEDLTPPTEELECPACGGELNYETRYFNHKGLYSCRDCEFSRPDPNVAVVRLKGGPDEWKVTLSYDVTNAVTRERLDGEFTYELQLPGLHNVYNSVCAISLYLAVTPRPEDPEGTIPRVIEGLEPLEFIPPGRFEVLNVGGKPVGVGQGDNGDAFKANANLMLSVAGNVEVCVYTTPDENEHPIFEMHRIVLRALDPDELHVFPGRESVEAAEGYYEELTEEFDAEFHSIPHDRMREKVEEMRRVCEEADGPVFASGCGPEHEMWEALKRELRGG